MNTKNVTEKETVTKDPTIARFEQLESKIANQRKTNWLLSLALLVSLFLGASNYEWVKKAWAASALMMDQGNAGNGMTSLTGSMSGWPMFLAVNNSTSSSSAAIIGSGSIGVKGTTGSGIGIHGDSGSGSGTGVKGSSGTGTGVIGESKNIGVYGAVLSTAAASGKSGVMGINPLINYHGNGIYGEAKGGGLNKSYGVFGYDSGAGTSSILGPNAAGVRGESIYNHGVSAKSEESYGLYAESTYAAAGRFKTGTLDNDSGQIQLEPNPGIAPASGTQCNNDHKGELKAFYDSLYFCAQNPGDTTWYWKKIAFEQ